MSTNEFHLLERVNELCKLLGYDINFKMVCFYFIFI